jgi:hypothetical protein
VNCAHDELLRQNVISALMYSRMHEFLAVQEPLHALLLCEVDHVFGLLLAGLSLQSFLLHQLLVTCHQNIIEKSFIVLKFFQSFLKLFILHLSLLGSQILFQLSAEFMPFLKLLIFNGLELSCPFEICFNKLILPGLVDVLLAENSLQGFVLIVINLLTALLVLQRTVLVQLLYFYYLL